MNETKTTMATVTAIEDAPISNGEERPKKSERVPPMNSNMAAIIATQAYRYLNGVSSARTILSYGGTWAAALRLPSAHDPNG